MAQSEEQEKKRRRRLEATGVPEECEQEASTAGMAYDLQLVISHDMFPGVRAVQLPFSLPLEGRLVGNIYARCLPAMNVGEFLLQLLAKAGAEKVRASYGSWQGTSQSRGA